MFPGIPLGLIAKGHGYNSLFLCAALCCTVGLGLRAWVQRLQVGLPPGRMLG